MSPSSVSRSSRMIACGIVLSLTLIAPPASAQQKIHEEYMKQIRKFTTDPHFLTEYVSIMPASSRVPTPLEVLGHIAGAADILSYSADVYKYMRALDAASPRVKVFTVGKTEEGRDWIVVAVADEKTMADLDRYKKINARLGDPRGMSDAEARRLIRQAKPVYYATGGMHSGETGSVEMLMELAYRVAVDESPFIKTIRDNSIVLITPILEVDGRDKQVDIHMAKRKDPAADVPSRLAYWGKYVAHDNNRDNLGLSLALSRYILEVFFDFHPQVMHDLHESASHLYISTGTGPYNAWLDPIVIDEWQLLAYQEVNDLTRQGVPGVWTHGFYDGWAPNYAFFAANCRNAIGRFYETQGAGDGSTRVITARGDRVWYRPNPPLPRTLWSIRNNVNLQQSALLVGMNTVAANATRFMENFWLKGKRSVAKARAEGPAAYVFPGDDPRPGQAAGLLRLLQQQGIEIHRADAPIKAGKDEFPAGSFVVRMDQPYSRMGDMMLDRQYFNVDDPRPYDDVGWTMGPLFNVKTVRVGDLAVLDVPMTLVKGEVRATGGVKSLGGAGSAGAYVINHNADNQVATFLFELKDRKIQVAEKAFEVQGKKFNAGSFLVRTDQNGEDLSDVLAAAGQRHEVMIFAVTTIPEVAVHDLVIPRIALMHTWQSTQDEGWVRIALDEMGIPYDYIDVQAVRDDPRLKDKYDVILYGQSRGDALSVLQGITGDRPQPWKKTALTPNLGLPVSTGDMRGGLEFEGVIHLRDFVKAGGVFITLANSSSLPIQLGLAQGISIKQTTDLWARGSVFKADVADGTSPLVYGYGDTIGIYFSQTPVFATGRFGGFRGGMMGTMRDGAAGKVSGRGSATDPDIPQGRPRDLGQKTIEEWQKAEKEKRERDKKEQAGDQKAGEQAEERAEERPSGSPGSNTGAVARTVLKFTTDVKNLLISGGLAGGEEMAGAPALVDSKLGEGHIVMFSFNPMWRHQTRGSHFLVLNAVLNWKNL